MDGPPFEALVGTYGKEGGSVSDGGEIHSFDYAESVFLSPRAKVSLCFRERVRALKAQNVRGVL